MATAKRPPVGAPRLVPPAELYLPAPAQDHVERVSVDELLDRAASRRICVVIGAAGWGKTTAVATWSRGRPTAWLRYEDHDGDPERLLAALLRALQAHVPVPAPGLGAVPDDTPQVGSSAAAMCLWLHSALSKDLVLVLDDLHGLQPDSDAACIVQSLCRRAPDRLHLVLISRRELPFSVQRLRGHGLVAEIHAPDLAFDVADVEALLGKTVGNGPPGLSRRVWEHTDGWPTAVHCAAEVLRGVQADQRLDAVGRLSQPGERFHGYLTEEVLGVAPEWVQQLLRRLAIYGEVRSPLEVARGLNHPTTVLADLSRQGLVRRSGGGSTSWLLVRPLREYFQHEAAPSATERTALLVAAATDSIGRGAPADALRHLLAAGDYAACAALLADHGVVMVQSGQLDAVLQAAELPAEYLDDPRIQRVLGQAHQVRGQWVDALQHFQRAGHDRDELEPALSWRVGLIAFAQGEFDEVQARIQRARLDREDTVDETCVFALSASAYRMTGDLVGLRKTAALARAAARRCGEPRAWSSVHHLFALQAAAEGDWRQADAHWTDALRSAEVSNDLLQLMWIRASRAFHHYEMGAPRQALAEAALVLSLGEQCEDPFVVAHALTTRGRACGRLGMLDEAAADFATAIDLFQRIGSRFLAWPLCGLGDLHRTRGQLVRSRAAYEEALALAEPYHDVFGLSSALIGLARIGATDDLTLARERAVEAVELGEGLRKVPALLARGWVELMGGDRQRASADANRAAAAARQRRDNPGLAEAITLSVLAADDPAAGAPLLREAIGIWQETGCLLEEAATRLVAAHIGAPMPSSDAERAHQTLRDYGVDVDVAAGRRTASGAGAFCARSIHPDAWQFPGDPRRGGSSDYRMEIEESPGPAKILVARRRPTPREQLMELLWPEVDPAVASNRLSVLLSALRDVLQPRPSGEDPLISTGGAVSLNRAQVSIDVDEFLTQATAALSAERSKEPDVTARLVDRRCCLYRRLPRR